MLKQTLTYSFCLGGIALAFARFMFIFFLQRQGWLLFPFFFSYTHDAWSTGCFLFKLCFPPGFLVAFIVFFCPSLPAKVKMFLFPPLSEVDCLICFLSAIVRGWLFWYQTRLIAYYWGEYLLLFVPPGLFWKAKILFLLSVLWYNFLETYYYQFNSIIYIFLVEVLVLLGSLGLVPVYSSQTSLFQPGMFVLLNIPCCSSKYQGSHEFGYFHCYTCDPGTFCSLSQTNLHTKTSRSLLQAKRSAQCMVL